MAVLLLVVISGMIATAMITPRYEANMSLLVSRDRSAFQISATDRSPAPPTEVSDEEFNSELELIKSSEVIAGVVRDLDLAHDQKPVIDSRLAVLRGRVKAFVYGFSRSGSASGSENEFTVEQLVTKVADRLVVTSNKKSRVIKVVYSDTDPTRAKKVLDKLYEKYLGLHAQLNETPTTGQVFDEQTDKFNQKLSQSTNALKQFDSQNGVTGAEIGVQRELLLRQLYEAQSQASAARTEINESEKRIADLKTKIAAQPERIQTGSVSKYVAALDKMKEELAQLQQQRTQLLQKYQPNSRFVRENEERIGQLRRSIADEMANPPLERSYSLNDLRRRLESEMSDAETNLAALRERESGLKERANQLRGQVEFLNTKSIERANLERDRSINEEAFLLYQKKTRENEITQVLNREQTTNLTAVDPARTDGEQKNPKPFLNFVVLIVIGLAAGFVGALVVDRYGREDDDFVTAGYELKSRVDLPLLASIPVIEEPRIEARSGVRRATLPPTAL
jgi:uncharacterized protein involved in exopolysaccharide biosynthesis